VKLIVGLGNPGRAYQWTRHNMGFWLIDQLAQKHHIDLSRKKLQSVYGRGKIGSEEVILAQPLTFMNLSGEAVSRLLHFFKILPENLLIIHDDLDLPLGKIRIRLRGGDGGHKGVQSIIEALGSGDFIRLKIGVGRPSDENQDPADFVLEPLNEKEKEEFKEVTRQGAEAVEVLLAEGPPKAMEHFHGNQKSKGKDQK
jgi:peptidyl-tRNA hydrolase, PTH1 family